MVSSAARSLPGRPRAPLLWTQRRRQPLYCLGTWTALRRPRPGLASGRRTRIGRGRRLHRRAWRTSMSSCAWRAIPVRSLMLVGRAARADESSPGVVVVVESVRVGRLRVGPRDLHVDSEPPHAAGNESWRAPVLPVARVVDRWWRIFLCEPAQATCDRATWAEPCSCDPSTATTTTHEHRTRRSRQPFLSIALRHSATATSCNSNAAPRLSKRLGANRPARQQQGRELPRCCESTPVASYGRQRDPHDRR